VSEQRGSAAQHVFRQTLLNRSAGPVRNHVWVRAVRRHHPDDPTEGVQLESRLFQI